jgi:hypothetical protein
VKNKLLIIAGVLVVVGAAAAGALYYVYPVQVSTIAGLTRNYLISWSTPLGMTTTELNAAYKTAGGVIAPFPPAERRWRLAELRQNTHLGVFLAVERDQYVGCSAANCGTGSALENPLVSKHGRRK